MHTCLRLFLTQSLLLLSSFAATLPAIAAEAGWRHIELVTASAQQTIPVALYYPTATPGKIVNMGPFQVNAAIQAPPAQLFKALIVLSHGLWGSELGHSSLAEALARSGYLVAALRHPGDNWQDHSLMEKTPALFFVNRPRALTQVIDGILDMPEWASRLPRNDKGPLIGALGHSAGGFSVIALAGGRADSRRIFEHCKANAAQDPIFCGVGGASENTALAADQAPPQSAAQGRQIPSSTAPLGAYLSPNCESSAMRGTSPSWKPRHRAFPVPTATCAPILLALIAQLF